MSLRRWSTAAVTDANDVVKSCAVALGELGDSRAAAMLGTALDLNNGWISRMRTDPGRVTLRDRVFNSKLTEICNHMGNLSYILSSQH